ncbi:MAG: PD-(D/E)XK nuclease family protein [Actinobacteria bacterium]|nr:PD-(D/E)XK nuclease family protein [Actinomycetota bacterium]
MPLTLLAGPANSGKVATLLDRYLASIDQDPVLIVPNRPDVDRIERDLLERSPVLLGGSIGTFADLFEQLARADGGARPVASDSQRALVVRRVLAQARLNGLGPSARFQGFSEALVHTLGELEAGLLEPADLDDEDLAALYTAYRGELERLGLWDRDYERRHAASRVAGELGAWDGRPVLAYGFEDLTGAEWALLEALSARSELTVSLPYEPGRTAFSSLERTAADLASLARGGIEELAPGPDDWTKPGLAYLERALFVDKPAEAPALSGELRFFEGAGSRATYELVGEEILGLLRAGVRAEEIAVVCPTIERVRAPLETAFSTLGIPFAVEGRLRLSQTPYGQALAALLRFAWLDGGRADLYAYLRSPYSGLTRAHVDYLEGRLRGRAVKGRERVEEETIKLRGKPLPILDEIRGPQPLAAARTLAEAMLRAAYGLGAPPLGDRSLLDLRAHESVSRVLDELEDWELLGEHLSRDEILASLERTTVRGSAAQEPGRVHVLDLMRARTRRYEVVFVLGLEQGSLPRRSQASPFLDDQARADIDLRKRGARLARPDQVSRERYLFYTACTRPSERLYLVREAATDDGSPREAGPFWDEVRAPWPTDEVERWTTRRRLSSLTWQLERAPTERERLRSLAALSAAEPDTATAAARANGWERRLERARVAFDRPTQLRHPSVLEELRNRRTFGVTELEVFADCSSIWFLDRIVGPRTIDGQADARLRGTIAHQALYKFFSGLPKALGVERVGPEQIEEAVVFLHRCLDEALESGLWLELRDVERSELEQGLRRDLEHFLRKDAELGLTFVPRRFEVLFGSERAAPELQAGLDLGGFAISGKIDRIDVDQFSARGIVQDYKSGKTALSAAKIDSELRLQIPLYMLVLRDLVGIEPLGGLYRALAGERDARGLLRAEAKDDLPGFVSTDYLDEDAFWGQVETAKERASGLVERIRGGDVEHDPKGGFPCPSWCELWSMCRVRRA